MKFKIEIDLTPKEFRDALGLPDVAGLQNDVLEAVKKKMEEGVEGFDPVSLFKSWISQGVVTAGELQRMLFRIGSWEYSGTAKKRSTKEE